MVEVDLRFEKSTLVGSAPPLLYAFHENPANAARVSPPGIVLDLMSGSAHARTGEPFALRLRFPLFPPAVWRGLWETARAPDLLVDTAHFARMPKWRHEHRFEPFGKNATKMTDRIAFSLRLPGWIAWAMPVLARPILHAVFAYRHAMTRRLFGRGTPRRDRALKTPA